MASGGLNGIALGTIGVGGIFLYAALTNKSIVKAIQYVVSGKSPTGVSSGKSDVTSISGSDASSSDSSSGDIGDIGTVGALGNGGSADVEKFLKSKTSNKAMIAGIMGNIQIESSFNSSALNAGEGAIGYCQWELGRRTNLQSFARAQGKSETDSTTQLQFMWHELITSYPLVYASMKVQTSPESAAAEWDAHYELSAGTSRGQREAAARSWYERI